MVRKLGKILFWWAATDLAIDFIAYCKRDYEAWLREDEAFQYWRQDLLTYSSHLTPRIPGVFIPAPGNIFLGFELEPMEGIMTTPGTIIELTAMLMVDGIEMPCVVKTRELRLIEK